MKYCYPHAVRAGKKDTISMTDCSDLDEIIEIGKQTLRFSFPLTKGRMNKKLLEERIELIKRFLKHVGSERLFLKAQGILSLIMHGLIVTGSRETKYSH